MVQVSASYLAAGANRHPSAADWDSTGLLAYGADRNIALWRPQNVEAQGVNDLLAGHTDTVNAVKFLPGSGDSLLLSGSVDTSVRVWKKGAATDRYQCTQTLSDHKSSVNCIAVSTRSSKIFVSGSADATVNVWSLDEPDRVTLKQHISITPRFFPLALALSTLTGAPDSYILAVAGTKDVVQLYVSDAGADFKLQATLTGHEGWIRSLEFTQESSGPINDLILSSASQDKYIRLWRVHQGKELPAAAASADPSLGAFMPGKSLSNKAHRFQAQGLDFSATFEALLFGHEDWIYSTKWRADHSRLQLLSASADNSLAIWEADSSTGVWVTIARMGEISSEKGSTTATGSTGGFWTGLWSPSGETVVCLGRTGSWRLWNYNEKSDRWIQGVGLSGHTQSVSSIAWSQQGEYLLSTSSDQTTRLHANWKREGMTSWHEMARPQIHGYDLNCIDSLGHSQFVSGADEKLLRVFNEPKAVAELLNRLCGFQGQDLESMPDAANMPVLGLSNKAIEAAEDDEELPHVSENDREAIDPSSVVHKSTLNIDHPPLEDQLSRHTLWPETEKLYGHGYEISALAASQDGSVIATACKASSLDHAVIRLFETKTWHEIKPPLTAHSLTIARLRFSHDDDLLLSVGRDRQWAVFQRQESGQHDYKLLEANPKGHSRMILDAAWAPQGPARIFATAGRDKLVKIWAKDNDGSAGFVCKATITEAHPVTAVDFLDKPLRGGRPCLALGTEAGYFKVYSMNTESFAVKEMELEYASAYLYPLRPITQLAWRPHKNKDGEEMELAVASEDSSLRVYLLGLSSLPVA